MKKLELKEINDRFEIFVDDNQLKIGWHMDYQLSCRAQFGLSIKDELVAALKYELNENYFCTYTKEEIDTIVSFIKCNLPDPL